MLVLFMTIIPLMVLAKYSTDLINSNMNQRAASQLYATTQTVIRSYEDELYNLQSILIKGISIILDDYYKEYQKNGDRQKLIKNLREISRKSELDFILVLNREKKLVASAHSSLDGVEVKSFSAIIDKVISTGKPLSSYDIFQKDELISFGVKSVRQAIVEINKSDSTFIAGLSEVVVVPIFNEDEDIIAVTVAGRTLAKSYQVPDSIGNITNATIMLAQLMKTGEAIIISTNQTTTQGKRAIGRLIPREAVTVIQSNSQQQFREVNLSKYELSQYYPLYDVLGNIIAVVYVGLPEKTFTELASQNIWLVSFISVLSLFIAIGFAIFFSREITTPILKLSDAAKRISRGDRDIIVNVKGSIELSQMGEAFNLMTENLRREESLRDDFVATLTHDLKVPLLAEKQTINYLSQGAYGKINEEQGEVLDLMGKTNASTLEMINTLLEVYRYDAGKNNIAKEKTDLNTLINETINEISPLAQEKKITINTRFEKNAIEIPVDKREIKRVLHNLLANAITSTLRRGQLLVKVDVVPDKLLYDRDTAAYKNITLKESLLISHAAIISVNDNGIGMNSDEMSNLFKRFSANKGRKPSSTGLGLYYSYQVVTAHGGNIWAESEEGKGSTFKFTIPLTNKE